jgi:NADH dehydrogenase
MINFMEKHILITGGNGFVGKQICKLASHHSIPIISISRSGYPKEIIEEEYSNVKWVAGDVFNPNSWKEHLANCSAVIHSIGIIEEIPEKGITFKKMILDSAMSVGTAAKAAGIKKFVFISAGAAAPETPEAYMECKIAAEEFLKSLDFNLTILKPGLIYGEEKPETLIEQATIANFLDDPYIGPQIRPNRPLHVKVISKVALYAAINESVNGSLSVDDIETLNNSIKL